MQYVYAIEVTRADNGEVVYSIDDHSKITNGVQLAPGNYKIVATSGSLSSQASYKPCYSGSQDVTITAGKVANITITTTLADVKVTATVDQAVSDFFDSYDLVISNNDSGALDFASENTVGYFRNTGKIKWMFTINFTDGSTRAMSGIFENTLPRDHYTVRFKLGDKEDNGDLEIGHSVDKIEDTYNITINGNGQKPVSYTVSDVNAWAKFVNVEATWEGEQPADFNFEYRVDGSTEWTMALGQVASGATVMTAKINGLSPNSKYHVRAISPNGKSAPVEFTTEDTPILENMSFETWTQKGKNWYANSTAADTYWGSGNEGVTYFLAGSKPSNTTPTDDAHSGAKAARLESIKVSIVDFAAGNIFNGSFSLNTIKPLDSPSFGQLYTGRPTSLSFWYKYLPKTWNKPVETDKCNAYILLGTWDKQIKSSQIKGLETVGCIAYGSFVSDVTVENYTKQKIEIVYKDTKTKPTSAIVLFSSSLRGDQYEGGLGSVMFVDDIEFGWE